MKPKKQRTEQEIKKVQLTLDASSIEATPTLTQV